MKKGNNTLYKLCKPNNTGAFLGKLIIPAVIAVVLAGCDLIKMKVGDQDGNSDRQPAARANDNYLYKDELAGIVAPGTPPQDSARLVEAYINSWIRKQLLIQEASRK